MRVLVGLLCCFHGRPHTLVGQPLVEQVGHVGKGEAGIRVLMGSIRSKPISDPILTEGNTA